MYYMNKNCLLSQISYGDKLFVLRNMFSIGYNDIKPHQGAASAPRPPVKNKGAYAERAYG